MPTSRQILGLLPLEELLRLVDRHAVSVDGRQHSAHLAERLDATGRPLAELLGDLPRDRLNWIGGGVGIHWDDPDEDLSIAGFLLGRRDVG